MRIFLFLLLCAHLSGHAAEDNVRIHRLPEQGVQVQAVCTKDDTVHLVWFSGAPGGGDLRYASAAPGTATLTPSIPVNSQPKAAVAMGTIRGAQIAVSAGWVHVIWNGSRDAKPTAPNGTAGLLYARRPLNGQVFEEQRQLITTATGLDGGSAIAAADNGMVTVLWHASAGATDESGRAIYGIRSSDNGATFGNEQRFSTDGGVCGCCGIRAGIASNGAVSVLYRSAANGQRDMHFLTIPNKGDAVRNELLDPWPLNTCPMSSCALAATEKIDVLSWETKGEVWLRIDQDGKYGQPFAVPNRKGPAKHPSVAISPQGEILVAWTEGTAWKRGGAVAWQRYTTQGTAIGDPGRADGLAPWGLAAVVARKDGTFDLWY